MLLKKRQVITFRITCLCFYNECHHQKQVFLLVSFYLSAHTFVIKLRCTSKYSFLLSVLNYFMETLYLTRHQQIGISEILYLEGMSNYTLIHTINQRKTMAAQTLHVIHSSINFESFIRINRSFILNTEYILTYSLENNKLIFQLSNGQRFTASRRRIKKCLDMIEVVQKRFHGNKRC